MSTPWLPGENDGEEDAGELGDLLAGFPCHVNLIPINPVKERKFRRSGEKNGGEFSK